MYELAQRQAKKNYRLVDLLIIAVTVRNWRHRVAVYI